jgi:hypothetical protein
MMETLTDLTVALAFAVAACVLAEALGHWTHRLK